MDASTPMQVRLNPIQTFEAFFKQWLIQQENLLNELRNTIHNPNTEHTTDDESEAQMNELVTRVSAHYLEYFTAKSKLAQHNIILLFSPTWFTPLEKSFLWIAGFKPGLAFHLVNKFINDLDNNQKSEIEQARKELKLEERDLMEEFTKIQEMIAAPSMMEMLKTIANDATVMDGEAIEFESAMEELKYDMEELVEFADFLRMKAVMRIMEILRAS